MWPPSPTHPPKKENHLENKKTGASKKIAATAMWPKLGLTITKAATSTMMNPRSFLRCFLGRAPSSALHHILQHPRSGDIFESNC